MSSKFNVQQKSLSLYYSVTLTKSSQNCRKGRPFFKALHAIAVKGISKQIIHFYIKRKWSQRNAYTAVLNFQNNMDTTA